MLGAIRTFGSQLRNSAGSACLPSNRKRKLAPVSQKSSEQLKNALRATVVQVEQESGVSPDDPALVALKQIVLQRIADLEFAQAVDQIPSSEATDSSAILSATSSTEIKGENATEAVQTKENDVA
jgi:hypothetical protein